MPAAERWRARVTPNFYLEADVDWYTGRRVVEAGLPEHCRPRTGTVCSDEVHDDGVECFVEIVWDSPGVGEAEGEMQFVCCGHLNFETEE